MARLLHIIGFIEGASNIFEKDASKIVLARSSAIPQANFAIILAVVGAIKITSGFLAKWI